MFSLDGTTLYSESDELYSSDSLALSFLLIGYCTDFFLALSVHPMDTVLFHSQRFQFIPWILYCFILSAFSSSIRYYVMFTTLHNIHYRTWIVVRKRALSSPHFFYWFPASTSLAIWKASNAVVSAENSSARFRASSLSV